MALQPWRTGKLIRIEQETSDTRRFWFEVPELDTFPFIPGQFVTLDLPIHEKPNKRWRSYSISSWPDGSNVFELIIVLDQQGLGTPYLFDQATVGTEIPFRGPQGVFTLKEPIEEDVVLVCTGTGIAPFRSMIQYLHRNGIPHRELHLVFGCRNRASLLYYDEMRALEKSLPGFHYHPVLSREELEGFDHGYVHAVYERICANRQPARFYLCGWKGMIDEARQRIQQLGYEKKDIHFEIYG